MRGEGESAREGRGGGESRAMDKIYIEWDRKDAGLFWGADDASSLALPH